MQRAAGLFVRAALIGVVIASVSLLAGFLFFDYLRKTEGPHLEDAYFYVYPGAQPEALATFLEQKGLIHHKQHYEWLHYWHRLPFAEGYVPKIGEYLVPAKASLNQIRQIFHEGKSVQRRITFPEGLTTTAILERLNTAVGLKNDVPDNIGEGRLFPDTYYYEYGMSQSEILSRMQAKMELELAEAWALRAENLPLDTPEKALILASIIEKETGQSGERALVSSVFINRLNAGMRLQSDPTVIYGVGAADKPNYVITKSDLKSDNSYNTYRIAALPPEPIANPGRAALDAALNPAKTEFLYFVADGKGGHYFSKTLKEHNRNVRKYRKSQENKK